MLKLSFLFAVILTLCIQASILAQEQVVITTYYPSPEGIYAQLRANRVVVHPTRAMPAADGNLFWGASTRRGMLLSDQGSSIELGGSGRPYIDFSNDNSAANDFDTRLQLESNTIFRTYADNVQLRNRANTDWADTYVKDIYLCHP